MNEDKVIQKLGEHDRRFDAFELGLAEIKRGVAEVKSDVKWMKDNSSELFTKLDKFIKLYEDQNQELASLSVQVARLEKRITEIEAKIKL